MTVSVLKNSDGDMILHDTINGKTINIENECVESFVAAVESIANKTGFGSIMVSNEKRRGKMIDLNGMAESVLETAKMREEKGQLKSDTMSIMKHCAGEVCEAVEAYSICYRFRGKIYEEELADIITCALIAAANEGADIEAALLRVQEKNARRAE